MASSDNAMNELQEGDPKRDLNTMISHIDQKGTEGEGEEDIDKPPTFDWNSRGPLHSNVKGNPKNLKFGTTTSLAGSTSASKTAQTNPSSKPMSTTTKTTDEPTTSDQTSEVVGGGERVEDKEGKETQTSVDNNTAEENDESDEDQLPEFGWNFRGRMGSNVQGNVKSKAAIEAQKEEERLKAAKDQVDRKAAVDPKKANKK